MSKIDEIIDKIEVDYDGVVINLAETKQQLLELLESCKPDNRDDRYIEEEQRRLLNQGNMQTDEAMHSAIGKAMGYNQATQQYHSNIRKLFDENLAD